MESDGYDIAISLLSDDESYGESLHRELRTLSDDLSVFFYPQSQRDIHRIGDGAIAFSRPFLDARLAVVLLRQRWGQTDWTRYERKWIRNRSFEGSAITVVRMERDVPLPEWSSEFDIHVNGVKNSVKTVAGNLYDRLQGVRDGADLTTSQTFSERSVARSRYEELGGRHVNSFKTPERLTCDGCSRGVYFETIHVVTLWAHKGRPATTEKLCDDCYQQRTPRVGSSGTDERFMAYAKQMLSSRVRQILETEFCPPATSLYFGFSGPHISLYVQREEGSQDRLGATFRDLQVSGATTERGMVDFFRAKIETG